MQVTLTSTGFKLCRNLVALDDAMVNELIEGEVARSPKPGGWIQFDASYALWKHLYHLLYRQTFNARGRTVKQSSFTALKRITHELNYVEFHPALQGLGMLQWQADTFPVWKIEPDEQGRIYSPYPMPGHEFVVLAPVWDYIPGEPKITRWLERPPESVPGRLSREDVHLRLQRHPVA